MSVVYAVPIGSEKKGAPLILMHFHKNFAGQFFGMEKKEVIPVHSEINKNYLQYGGFELHTAVAHLAIQKVNKCFLVPLVHNTCDAFF